MGLASRVMLRILQVLWDGLVFVLITILLLLYSNRFLMESEERSERSKYDEVCLGQRFSSLASSVYIISGVLGSSVLGLNVNAQVQHGHLTFMTLQAPRRAERRVFRGRSAELVAEKSLEVVCCALCHVDLFGMSIFEILSDELISHSLLKIC